jgi:lysozyme
MRSAKTGEWLPICFYGELLIFAVHEAREGHHVNHIGCKRRHFTFVAISTKTLDNCAMSRVTKEGIDLIKGFEGCALRAYQDQEGRWTLGWGRARGIKRGDTCTVEQANLWLMEDIAIFEALVLHCVENVALSDNEVSALTSFTMNVGLGKVGEKDGFEVLKSGEPSTLLKLILEGDMEGAADEFIKWDFVGGHQCGGLYRRRVAEQRLFLKPDGPNDQT